MIRMLGIDTDIRKGRNYSGQNEIPFFRGILVNSHFDRFKHLNFAGKLIEILSEPAACVKPLFPCPVHTEHNYMFNHNAAKVLIILVSGKPWLRKFHIASGPLIVGVPRIVIQFLNILFNFARGGLFVTGATGLTGICIYVLFFRVHIISY